MARHHVNKWFSLCVHCRKLLYTPKICINMVTIICASLQMSSKLLKTQIFQPIVWEWYHEHHAPLGLEAAQGPPNEIVVWCVCVAVYIFFTFHCTSRLGVGECQRHPGAIWNHANILSVHVALYDVRYKFPVSPTVSQHSVLFSAYPRHCHLWFQHAPST